MKTECVRSPPMQAASGWPCRGTYSSRFRDPVIVSFCVRTDFFLPPTAGVYFVSLSHNPTATPFVLLALLLLAVPSEFALQKFVVLPLFGDRSHQFDAEQGCSL